MRKRARLVGVVGVVLVVLGAATPAAAQEIWARVPGGAWDSSGVWPAGRVHVQGAVMAAGFRAADKLSVSTEAVLILPEGAAVVQRASANDFVVSVPKEVAGGPVLERAAADPWTWVRGTIHLDALPVVPTGAPGTRPEMPAALAAMDPWSAASGAFGALGLASLGALLVTAGRPRRRTPEAELLARARRSRRAVHAAGARLGSAEATLRLAALAVARCAEDQAAHLDLLDAGLARVAWVKAEAAQAERAKLVAGRERASRRLAELVAALESCVVRLEIARVERAAVDVDAGLVLLDEDVTAAERPAA